MRNTLMSVGMLLAMSGAVTGCCAFGPHSARVDRNALIRDDFVQATSGMKVAIAENYENTGKLAAGNSEVGLPEPEEIRGQSLRSATVGPNGVIELVFDAKSGKDGGRIRLIPDPSDAEAMGVRWRCETPDYPQIKRALPTCDYVSR
jgi:hypothetical protein